MIGAMCMLASVLLGGGDLSAKRAGWAAATGEPAQIESGLALLDRLLGEAWSDELIVDLAMLGLLDQQRTRQARDLLDEAMVVSALVDAALRTQTQAGKRVSLDAARWERARGLACAAFSLVSPLDSGPGADAAAEAMVHLGPLRAHRAQRLISHLQWRSGDKLAAEAGLRSLRDSSTTPPLEAVAGSAVALRLGGGQGWRAAIESADESWRVVLLAEAAMAGLAANSAHAEAMIVAGVARGALVRSGLSDRDAFAMAAAMARRVDVHDIHDTDPCPVVSLVGGARGAMDAGRAMQARVWMTSTLARTLTPLEAGEAAETLAKAEELMPAHATEAMRAWRFAAEQGGPKAGRRWDRAASVAVGMASGPDPGEALAVLDAAATRGTQAAGWTRTRAAIEVRHGDVDAAVHRLQGIVPGGPDQLEAMREIGLMLQSRADRRGQWQRGDGAALQGAYAAAMAAAVQQHNQRRADHAKPVAAELGAVIVEWTLEQEGEAAAAARRHEIKAMLWLPSADRLRLDASIAAAAGEVDTLRTLLARSTDSTLPRSVLARARSLEPDKIQHLLGAFDSLPTPGGSPDELLAIADLLRRGGRCDEAVRWYDELLAQSPSLLPAVLGRCECLYQSTDRAVLAGVAQDYRRIAAMPRQDDPARWRRANTRLLEVLRAAGADPARLDASLARLRAIDPLIE